MTIFRLSRRVGFNVSGSVRTLGNPISTTPAPTPPPPAGPWIIPPPGIDVTEGQTGLPAGQYDVAATGPPVAAPGGVYDVDSGGTPLPAGMDFNAAGLLDVGTAAPAAPLSGVKFSYLEPNAITNLTVHPKRTGTALPYLATVYPLEGTVPAGMTLTSPSDANLRASVISTWPDDSAQIMVLAGATNMTNGTPVPITLRSTAPLAGTAVPPTRVGQLVTSVSMDFGSIGVATITSFDIPEFTWWSNSAFICARYRAAIGTTGLEAVIDIHAWAAPVNFAFVEVVIENGKLDANASIPVSSGPKTYTAATVSVNGVVIQTVDSAGQTNPTNGGNHQFTRAWYTSTWVGPAGVNDDPLVYAVTHDTAALQQHPMFWKAARAITVNFTTTVAGSSGQWLNQGYQTDKYLPWKTGRHATTGMPGSGEGTHGWIGILPGWDCDYMLTGNKDAWNASLQSGLCLHSFNLCSRDSNTGLVPSPSQISNNFFSNNTWPSDAGTDWLVSGQSGTVTNACMEEAHMPAGPLVPFLCRPSPCLLELAQKFAIGIWLHQNFPRSGQIRGRAWVIRNLSIGLFLTPNIHPKFYQGVSTDWITSGRTLLCSRWYGTLLQFKTGVDPHGALDIVYDYYPWNNAAGPGGPANSGGYEDHSTSRPRFSCAFWMASWIPQALVMSGAMKLMRASTEIANWDSAVDWACLFPIRFVNECENGEWRLIELYTITIGDHNGTYLVPAGTDWGTARRSDYTDAPPVSAGPWLSQDYNPSTNPNYNKWSSAYTAAAADNGYDARFWAGLCAAVERGIPGADQAWAKVYGTAENGQVTNLTTWLNGFSVQCLCNRVARV